MTIKAKRRRLIGKLAGKVVEASIADGLSDVAQIGAALKRLRMISSLTQVEMAARLGIQQAAVSKIERGSDVHISTVRKYVEALGASLRINASFPAGSSLALHVRDAFDVEFQDDDQLVLPLLGDEPFRPQRDVVLSIRPQYSEKILTGEKSVELRRRFPVAAPKGALAYIYATSPVRSMVGVAEIKTVLKLPVYQIWTNFESNASIVKDDFDKYFEGLDFGYVLMFGNVRSLPRPIPLAELREQFGFEPPQSFLYAKRDLRKALDHESAIVSH